MSDTTQARPRLRSGWRHLLWPWPGSRPSATPRREDDSSSLSAAERALSQSHAQLAERTRHTEPDFVKLASVLRELHAGAAALNRVTNSTLREVGGTLRHTRLGGDDGLVTRSLRDLTAGVDRAAGQLQALQRTASSLVHLHDESEHLARIALVLKSSCCSFAVESARSPELQQAFGAFVNELRQLATKIARVGEVVGDHSRTAHASQQQSVNAINAGVGELRQLVGTFTRTVQSASTRIQDLLDSVQMAASAVEARMSRIGEHANRAVYFMQFGDIVRQKLEHIVDALARVASTPIEPAGDEHSRRAANLSQLVTVQLAQLATIRAELHQARAQLMHAFSGLAGETDLLVADLQGLADRHGATDGNHDKFQHLHRDLAELQQLHARGGALHQQARETAARATAASAELARHLDEIKQVNLELHHQALNAIVKTAWLGAEGRTLGVLSAHVHEVSQQSSLAVSELLPHLDQLRAGIAKSDTAVEEDAAAADGADGLPRHLATVQALRERFRSTSAEAAQLAEAQRRCLERAGDRLRCLESLSDDLGALMTTLGELQPHLRDLAGERIATPAILPPESYTMESEREVHRRATTGAGMGAGSAALVTSSGLSSAPMLASSQPDPASDGSLGDNVELF